MTTTSVRDDRPGFPCPGCNGLRSALCWDCEAAAAERAAALHDATEEPRRGTLVDGVLHWTDAEGVQHSGPFLDATEGCEHEWRNDVVASGRFCRKCGRLERHGGQRP